MAVGWRINLRGMRYVRETNTILLPKEETGGGSEDGKEELDD